MAINKKLIHFRRKEVFEEKLANNEILDTSIVFIGDTNEIWTHGQFYGSNTSEANVKAVDVTDTVEDINIEYATKEYVDSQIGDINSVLESIING